MAVFDDCFSFVIGAEGGYTDNPNDPGNWTGGAPNQGQLKGTKFGISAKAYPNLDIPNISLSDAEAIYRRDYWNRLQGDSLPPPVALVAFDSAVNAGVGNAARWLQMAVGAKPDGVIGPQTLAALAAKKPGAVVVEMLAQRNAYNYSLSVAVNFGLGWSRRLFAVSQQAAIMQA